MKINWKSLALVLSGILVGCAGSAAQTAYASGESRGGGSFKCLGPSGSAGGIEDDLNSLVAQGYEPIFATGAVVCGKR